MEKISFYSRLIKWAIVTGAALHFAVWTIAIFTQNSLPTSQDDSATASITLFTDYKLDAFTSEITQLSQAGMNGLFWLSLPQVVLYIFIYWSLFQLFSCYQKGEIFAISAIQKIRLTGRLFILWPIVNFVYGPLLIFICKMLGLLEHGEINIGLGSDDFRLIVLGVMLSVAGRIMHEAKTLQEEQELTV